MVVFEVTGCKFNFSNLRGFNLFIPINSYNLQLQGNFEYFSVSVPYCLPLYSVPACFFLSFCCFIKGSQSHCTDEQVFVTFLFHSKKLMGYCLDGDKYRLQDSKIRSCRFESCRFFQHVSAFSI